MRVLLRYPSSLVDLEILEVASCGFVLCHSLSKNVHVVDADAVDPALCEDWATWFAFSGKNGTGLENTTILVIRGGDAESTSVP